MHIPSQPSGRYMYHSVSSASPDQINLLLPLSTVSYACLCLHITHTLYRLQPAFVGQNIPMHARMRMRTVTLFIRCHCSDQCKTYVALPLLTTQLGREAHIVPLAGWLGGCLLACKNPCI